MNEKEKNASKERRIKAIMEQWDAEVAKIPEATGLPPNTFSQKWAMEAQKPYLLLRDKYMPMIEKIKSE